MTNRPPLTVDEAVTALKISDKTVRRMLKTGILQEQERDAKGRILISALSIDQAASSLAEQHNHDNRQEWLPAQAVAQTTALERAVETLTDMLERREERIEELERSLRTQGDELAELRAERKYLPSPDRVHELEQKIRDLEAKPLDAGPVTDQAPEPTRKGWIDRLLGRG